MRQRPAFPTSSSHLSRRGFLRVGAAGLSLPTWLALQQSTQGRDPAVRSHGRAKSCIVLFAWGGMSHLDTWDVKPNAASDTRSAFKPIKTSTPGIHLCEHMPGIARHTHEMTIVRSVHHEAPSHRSAAYWNLTGHPPPNKSGNWERSRQDWPCIGSMVDIAQRDNNVPRDPSLPGAVCLPYEMYDGGYANGQHAGFLGIGYDPVIFKPPTGRPFEGKSPNTASLNLKPVDGIDGQRLAERRSLLSRFNASSNQVPGQAPTSDFTGPTARFQEQALDLLLAPKARDAFDVSKEPAEQRKAYGDHICGQSVLAARRLVEAGVPIVTVYCAAGDLNGSAGAHWDTHGNGFNRIKGQMLPPLDQASDALLTDLAASGRLDDTLVVWLTEFGRTPKVNGSGGRDHYPNCYSVAFAGAGVAGGMVYGASDKTGAEPAEKACRPEDLHATIFHAMGIDLRHMIHDLQQRPVAICDGQPLPIFA